MAAQMCGLLGYDFPTDLMEPNVWNVQGYFESRSLAKMHDRLFQALGSAWWDPRAFDDQWQADPKLLAVWSEGQELISAMLARDRPLLIKDPRISRFLPLWLPFLQALNIPHRLLLVVRRPSEVARSLFSRDHLPGFVGGMLWWRYVTDVLRSVRALEPDANVVTYDALLTRPEETLDMISRWAAIENAQPEQACHVPNPDLRRSSGQCHGFSGTGLERDCEILFECLSKPQSLLEVEVALDDPWPLQSGLDWWPHMAPLVRKHQDLLIGIRGLSRMV
ncbi:sulfotransferase family protein [Maricaulis maris]|jgi:hypothetical protein|nr:hypothetical protein [Maricaulis maris]